MRAAFLDPDAVGALADPVLVPRFAASGGLASSGRLANSMTGERAAGEGAAVFALDRVLPAVRAGALLAFLTMKRPLAAFVSRAGAPFLGSGAPGRGERSRNMVKNGLPAVPAPGARVLAPRF